MIRWRIGKLDERYECKHCETYLKYPVQFIECCHRVCSTCLTDILRQSSTCPTCDKPIQRENIQIDHEFQKEINNIPVFCKNRQAGCNWEGSFKEHFVRFQIQFFLNYFNKINILIIFRIIQKIVNMQKVIFFVNFARSLLKKRMKKAIMQHVQSF